MKVKNVLKSVSIVLVVAIFSTILTSGFSSNQVLVNKNVDNYISNEPTFENTELENLSQNLLSSYSEFCNAQNGGSKLEIIESARSLKTQTQQYLDEFTTSSKQTADQINGLDDIIINRQNEYEDKVTKSANNLIAVLDSIINQNSETESDLFEKELKEVDTYFTTNNITTTCTDSIPNEINIAAPSVIDSDSSLNSNNVEILNNENTLTNSALSETDEVQITDEMKSLADELQTPLNVYNYLKNNINYEPYYGSRKGAVATFESKAGNDVDQASLLIAMLRYLKYPSRYVTGTIILDVETACALTYTDRIEDAANILAASGRPTSLINDNGEITSVRIEQTWVEAYVPYTDYRGVGNKSGEKMWIPLDTSIKKYEKVDNIYDDLDELGITQEAYDAAIESNNLDAYLSNIETTVNDYYSNKETYIVSKKIKEENLDYLPLSTQYTIVSADSTYDSIENNKADRISFSIDGRQITEQKALNLYGKRLIIEYEPETDNDKAVIDKYGSIFDTPAYMVKMAPVLKLDGETIGKGKAVTLGGSQQFTMTVYSDNEKRTVDNTITAGSVYQITEDMQNITEAELTSAMNSAKDISSTINTDNVYSDEYLGKILDFAGKMYFAQVDIADNIIAEKMNISATRSLSIGMTG